MLGSQTTRMLRTADLDDVLAVLNREPIANAVVTARVTKSLLDPWKLGGELWGWYQDGQLEALCFAGANLVPVCAGTDAVQAFAQRALSQGRRCTSLVGPHAPTAKLWRHLEADWGPAREVRAPQPLLTTSQPAEEVTPNPRVRRVVPDDLDLYLPACVDMFTEEVGVSPLSGADGGRLFRSRAVELVATGRAFTHIEDGRVLFKAEISAVTDQVCQVQGVWVHPQWRGHGLAGPSMAAVLRYALTEVAPRVSLYVNDFNLPARATYRRCGMHEVGAMMSVLF